MGYLGTKPQTATQLADNIVTSDKIQAGAVGTTDIADGAVTGTKLENSGVTAGTYGSASAIPAVTVDAKGRITSVTTNAVSGGVTSLNGQTGAITNTTLNAIGSHFIGYDISVPGRNNSTFTAPGTTTAGSNLRNNTSNFASAFGDQAIGTTYLGGTLSSAGLSGTWRRLSAHQAANSGEAGYFVSFLFVRVS